jgi:uncharacterized protein (DUF58 family)
MLLAARCYAFAVLVCALAIMGQWTPAIGEDLWRMPAAALLLALIIEGVVSRRQDIRFERRLPVRGFLGQPLASELVVHNTAPYTLELDTLDDPPPALAADYVPLNWRIAPGSSSTQRVSLTPRELGEFDWATLRTRSLGAFGLAWWHRRLELPASLPVVPDHLHAEDHRAGSAEQGRYVRSSSGGGTELMGFRDYQRGDPLRSIDWKATARRSTPIVRLYATEEHVELVLAVDAGRTSGIQSGSLTRLGHYANVAARLAEKSLANGDHVGLVVFAEAPLYVAAGLRGVSGLERIRAALAGMRTQARESNPLAAALHIRRIVSQRSLVVIFTDMDEGEIAGQLRRATSFLTPKHQPVIASLMDEDVLEMRWRHAERWIDPYAMLAALEITKGARRTALHLERSGAHVVLARPAELDKRVLGAYETLRSRRRV